MIIFPREGARDDERRQRVELAIFKQRKNITCAKTMCVKRLQRKNAVRAP